MFNNKLILEKILAKAKEYTDDQEAALEPAKALGIDTILFLSIEELMQELRAKYILI